MSFDVEMQKCPVHLLEIVVIDLKSSTDMEDKKMCVKCLTQKIDLNNLALINETKQMIQDMKKQSQILIKQKENQKLENLQVLFSQLQEYKVFSESVIAKLILNVEQKMNLIKLQLNQSNNDEQEQFSQDDILMLSQQNQGNLQFAVPEEDTSKEDYQNFISSSLKQFESLTQNPQKNEIITSFEKLQQEQFQQIHLYQAENKKVREFEKHKTPHLSQKCMKHKKEIIMLNLNNNCQGSRLACVKCVQETPIQYIDLEEANIKWENIQEQSNHQFTQNCEKRNKKQEILADIIFKWKEKYVQILNQMINNIQEYFQQAKNYVEQKSRIQDKQLFNLNETELIKAIDILCQTQNQVQLLQDFSQQEKEDEIFYKDLQDRISNLVDFEGLCYQQINDLLQNTQDQRTIKKLLNHEIYKYDDLQQEFQEFQKQLDTFTKQTYQIKEFIQHLKLLIEQKINLDIKLRNFQLNNQINLQKQELNLYENLQTLFLQFENSAVEQFNDNIKTDINILIQEQNTKIEQLNDQILNLAKKIQQLQDELEKERQQSNQKTQTFQKQENELQNQIQLFSQQINQINHNSKDMEQQLKNINDSNQSIINNLNKEKDQLSQQFASLKEAYSLLQQGVINYSKDLLFSTKFKQQEVEILENGKIAYAKNNVWQVCVCEQPIPKQTLVSFKFKIVQMHQFYAGICFRDIISQDYRGYVSDLGHGYYLMCKDGYIYSHHDKEKNGKSLGFKFQADDIIEIEVDMKQQMIKWINEKNNQSYTLSIETNKELYPCFRIASSKVLLLQ